jgi:hypothetical protein
VNGGDRFLLGCLVIGMLIDGPVALLSLFAPSLLTPLFDIPVKDPAAIMFGGGEFAVVTLVYICLLADPRRFRPLLWLVALDQAFAVVLPLIALASGVLPHTWKTVGPLPVSAALCIAFVWGATRRTAGSRRA